MINTIRNIVKNTNNYISWNNNFKSIISEYNINKKNIILGILTYISLYLLVFMVNTSIVFSHLFLVGILFGFVTYWDISDLATKDDISGFALFMTITTFYTIILTSLYIVFTSIFDFLGILTKKKDNKRIIK